MDLLPEERTAAADEVAGWPALVEGCDIWTAVAGQPGADQLRAAAVALVTHLAARRRETLYLLADDPWQDPWFAGRMLRRATWLAGHLPGGVRAAEAALLLTAPFVYETLWAGMAARERGLRPHDLTPSQDATSDRAAFERFTLGFGQPRRRATDAVREGRWDAAEEIGWWLLHRWLSRRPEAYRPESVAELLGPELASGVWRAGRLAELLRAVRADPGFLARTDRNGVLADTGPDRVRERAVGYLLAAARAMAVETPTLPEVIGEHLGIADPVTAAGIRQAVEGAEWRARGTALVLAAGCGHPAVEVALRTHLDGLNQLLTEAHQAAAASQDGTAVLRHLPTHVTAEGLRPATVDGAPAYQSAGVRFRLAEDRVRELLMGEQLYGDPTLAIRELYQNALDACRYRQARTEYLRRTTDAQAPWDGWIRFEQGVDADGRPYLDCVDNGIGMGVRELTEVFSQAGVRMADLPEFVEEQAEWARLEPPVQVYPNSRFGIGVLSYFMLADEITVVTSRLGRDGVPGDRLKISIAGPGSLFRIQVLPAEDDHDAGTTVRLHLRHDGPAVNCVQVLRELLWVADFHTEAANGSDRRTWSPGELSDAPRPDADEDEPTSWGAAVPARGARVWWCRGTGAVLADGLWAGESIHGAVVNLSRELAPRLSVDRTRILAYRQEDVDRLLWEAVGALVDARGTVLTFDWLFAMSRERPLVADLVFEQALAGGYRQWALDDVVVDAAVTGCFGYDQHTMAGPDELVEWRLTALVAGGRYRKLVDPDSDWQRAVRAAPSDHLILSADLDGSGPWLDPVGTVPPVHLVRAARRVGRSIAAVAARLEALGFEPATGCEQVGSDPDDLTITSRDLDGERPWLPVEEPVTVLHLLRSAAQTGRPLAEIVARLRQLGHEVDVDLATLPVDHLEPDDLVIASRDLDGRNPWLPLGQEISALHVLRAARRVGRPPSDLAARLASLGHLLAPGCAALGDAGGDDVVLASRDLDATAPWLDLSEPVSPAHVLRAAEKTGRPVAEVLARLSVLGYRTPEPATAVEAITLDHDDLVLLSRNLDGRPPWLRVDRPVPPVHLLRAAKELHRPLAELVARLTACGHRVDIDPEGVIVDQLEPDDLVLASVDLDGASPWLSASELVPLTHLIRAANRTRRGVHDVAARLTVLGYGVRLECGSVTADQFDTDDLLLASRDLDSAAPWLDQAEPVPLAHLVLAAGRTRRPIPEIAARMQQLGYRIDVGTVAFGVQTVDLDDLILVSEDLDGRKPWLDPERPVSVAHLVGAARRTRRTLAEVAARLGALGYQVPDLAVRLPRLRPGGV